MKKILFVINTLSRAGAETALLELLKRLDKEQVSIDLFVLTGIGEMINELPDSVNILNKSYSDVSILTKEGRARLNRIIVLSLIKRANIIRLFPYILTNLIAMLKKREVLPDKLLWRVLSDGAMNIDSEYDLAVAYLEGGSTYYVADHIKAEKKVAFVHVDYNRAGYSRKLDKDCYIHFDRIYTVSNEVRESFIYNYPECENNTEVFSNLLGRNSIQIKSKMEGGFSDGYQGKRILTIGRLTKQKAFEVSIEAMKLLKERGKKVRWYVLGDGDQRNFLEGLIKKMNLEEDFILLGKVDNPYPFLIQTDLYVHASRFEGKSIAIQEAALLGCPILVSDCEGNREQIENDVDGRMCSFDSTSIADNIDFMIMNPDICREYGKRASEKMMKTENEEAQIRRFLDL